LLPVYRLQLLSNNTSPVTSHNRALNPSSRHIPNQGHKPQLHNNPLGPQTPQLHPLLPTEHHNHTTAGLQTLPHHPPAAHTATATPPHHIHQSIHTSQTHQQLRKLLLLATSPQKHTTHNKHQYWPPAYRLPKLRKPPVPAPNSEHHLYWPPAHSPPQHSTPTPPTQFPSHHTTHSSTPQAHPPTLTMMAWHTLQPGGPIKYPYFSGRMYQLLSQPPAPHSHGMTS